jgi:hypothetical protein
VSGFHLNLRRKQSLYIMNYFLPCGLMVIVSWCSFAVCLLVIAVLLSIISHVQVRADMVPGRLGLLLTLLLVLVNLSSSVTVAIPRSDKLAPLVLWIWLSVLFVTLALAEYTVILMVLKFRGGKVEL